MILDIGQSPDPEKVQAIRDFPAPQNKDELSSFNGLVQ